MFSAKELYIFKSSPSVKFTPSQPPSPLLPYGDSGYPSLFRRWSAHTHNFGNTGAAGSGSSSGSGPNPTSSTASAFSSYGSSGVSGGFNPVGYSRRWSVPASAGHVQGGGSSAGTNSSIQFPRHVYEM